MTHPSDYTMIQINDSGYAATILADLHKAMSTGQCGVTGEGFLLKDRDATFKVKNYQVSWGLVGPDRLTLTGWWLT